MESVGEEMRIQELFSEARLADEQITPSFVGVWNRAQSKTGRTQRAFNLAFVAATALLVCALVSLAWWSMHWQRSPQVIASTPAPTAVTPASVIVDPVKGGGENQETNSSTPVRRAVLNSKSPTMKLAARREASLLAANRLAAADRKAEHELKAITSWQSPTAKLLDSPSDELLKSLPQLNHTADELKSFLPSQPK
jgi:hypothetical protein